MLAAYSVERDPMNPAAAVVVRAVSMVSGKDSAMSMPLTIDAFTKGRDAYYRGALIQDAFPTLDADAREFIKTGITQKEWDAMFAENPNECEACDESGDCGRCR